jgi:hypothetical protein
MVSVAKMKVDQRERELSYAKQAEVCNSICTLSSEKRQLMIQMQAERVKKIRPLPRLRKSWSRTMRYW